VIKEQIIKENNKPIAVVLDFEEYKRLKPIEEDRFEYYSALKIKVENKKWTSHKDLKKALKI
jgi:PHD/YefM family antitoxin component YafN of YafNO toxin-antitoxin module